MRVGKATLVAQDPTASPQQRRRVKSRSDTTAQAPSKHALKVNNDF